MKDIDLRPVQAVFLDRGNVTHDCRSGAPDEVRERESARELSAFLRRVAGRDVDAVETEERLIRPWKDSFALRRSRGREVSVAALLRTFLSAQGITLPESLIDEGIDVFGSAYVRWDVVNPGLLSLLRVLRAAHKKVGILSNSVLPDRVYVRKFVEDGLDPYIDCYVFSYGRGVRKPDIRILEMGCRELEVDVAAAMVVGDKVDTDVLCARRAGAGAIWYNPGHGENRGTVQPDYVVGSFQELEDRIQT